MSVVLAAGALALAPIVEFEPRFGMAVIGCAALAAVGLALAVVTFMLGARYPAVQHLRIPNEVLRVVVIVVAIAGVVLNLIDIDFALTGGIVFGLGLVMPAVLFVGVTMGNRIVLRSEAVAGAPVVSSAG